MDGPLAGMQICADRHDGQVLLDRTTAILHWAISPAMRERFGVGESDRVPTTTALISQRPWRTGNPSAFPGLDADWGSTPPGPVRRTPARSPQPPRPAPHRRGWHPHPRAPAHPLVLALDVTAADLVLSR
ncbi:hypothetical protein HEP87_59205 [Streptomyces sp. S1D4-11]